MNPFLVLSVLAALAWSGRTQELFGQLPSCAVCRKEYLESVQEWLLTGVQQLNCTTQMIDRTACLETDKACLCTDIATFTTGISGCSTGFCTTDQVQCKYCRSGTLWRPLMSPNLEQPLSMRFWIFVTTQNETTR